MQIGLLVGVPAPSLQPLSGDLSARHVAEYRPVKFAAAEAHHHTGPMPFAIGGWSNVTTGTNGFAVKIQGEVSLVIKGSASASILGLDAVPREDRAPVGIVRVAFQIMIVCGIIMVTATMCNAHAVGASRGRVPSMGKRRAAAQKRFPRACGARRRVCICNGSRHDSARAQLRTAGIFRLHFGLDCAGHAHAPRHRRSLGSVGAVAPPLVNGHGRCGVARIVSCMGLGVVAVSVACSALAPPSRLQVTGQWR